MSEHLFLGAGFLAHRPGAPPRDRMEGAPPGAAPPKELLPGGGFFAGWWIADLESFTYHSGILPAGGLFLPVGRFLCQLVDCGLLNVARGFFW